MRLPLAFLLLFVAAPAYAGDWVWESDDADERAGRVVRFSLHANVWISTYDRPASACQPTVGFPGGEDIGLLKRRLRTAQFPGFSFCNNENSEEIGVGPGVDVQFRAFGPLYVTVGLELFYTDPSDFGISNQVVIAVPFGIRLTWPHWALRPIAEAVITPVLFLTDDARDYTLGGRFGIAYRLLAWGDLSLLIGHQKAETLSNWSVSLGVHPIL